MTAIAWYSMLCVFVSKNKQYSIRPQLNWYVKTHSMSSQWPFHIYGQWKCISKPFTIESLYEQQTPAVA